MENLLPAFQGADVEQYGWRIPIATDPDIVQARPRVFPPRRASRNQQERGRGVKPQENNRNAIGSDTDIKVRQQRRKSQSSSSPDRRRSFSRQHRAGSEKRRPGTAMQFFRPGSVLRDQVPRMKQRPRTSDGGARRSRRHHRQSKGNLKSVNAEISESMAILQTRSNNAAEDCEDDEDTVFLTRPPLSSEQYISGDGKFDDVAMEALAFKHKKAEAADRQHGGSTLSLGQRWREQNKRRLQQQNEANGTSVSVPSGTALRLANCQGVETEIFMSAPSGSMNVLQLRPAMMMDTSTRRLGKLASAVTMEDENVLVASDSQSPQHGQSALVPYIFALGSPQNLSRFMVASRDDDVATTVKFSNVSAIVIQIFWIDYDGRPLPRMRLEPGESYTEASWQSHPWYVQPCYTARGKISEKGAGIRSTSESSPTVVENVQGCLIVLAKSPEDSGDMLNVVYNPPSLYRQGSPGKLSLSALARSSSNASSSRAERVVLGADSHVVPNPFESSNGLKRRNRAEIRKKAVTPFGLTWGDRRAGRRPASAGGSSRESVRILRDQKFQHRRIRHSTRIVKMRQSSEDNNVDLCFTFCPPIQLMPGMPGMPSRKSRSKTSNRKRPGSAPASRIGRHRGISSASSWKK